MKRQTPITNHEPRSMSHGPCGFSMVELVIVMGIIILVLTMALPAFNKLMQGSNVKQATNMISAYLASARAAAVQQRRSVAVVFCEEVSNANTAVAGAVNTNNLGQTSIVLAREVAVDSAGTSYFSLLPGRMPDYLPPGVKVATLNGGNTMTTEALGAATVGCRAIVFNANGQMVLRTGLALSDGVTTASPYMPQLWAAINGYQVGQIVTDTVNVGVPYMYLGGGSVPHSPGSNTPLSPSTATTADLTGYKCWVQNTWNFAVSTSYPLSNAAISNAASSPGMTIYDGNDFAKWYGDQGIGAMAPATAAPLITTWLQNNADLLIVNTYTGGVIR